MPDIFMTDDGGVVGDIGFDGISEAQRVEQAKAELIQEQFGTPEPLILGKFQGQEALTNAYTAAEAKISQLAAELAALKAAPPAATTPETPTPPAATGEAPPTEPVSAPPVTTPETPAPSTDEPPAVPPEVQQRIRSSLLAQAGGEEEFGKLAQWATSNLPQDRLASFNASLAKGDEAAVMTSLKAIQFDRLMKQGYEPPLLGGSQGDLGGVTPFRSENEVTEAMADYRYNGPSADPAYVEEVTRRLAASPNLFRGRE
jgi:hypothetical protein